MWRGNAAVFMWMAEDAVRQSTTNDIWRKRFATSQLQNRIVNYKTETRVNELKSRGVMEGISCPYRFASYIPVNNSSI